MQYWCDTQDKQGDNFLHPICMNLYQFRQFIEVFKNLIIDGADKIENVCSMEIVIRNMIFWKKKWVDYKNYT